MRVAPLILWLTVAGVARAADPSPERVTYLGVATSAATPALREQLGLPRGVGVVVDAVEAGSPAERAGLAVHDVLTRWDEQVLINVHQFGVLVRLQKAGDAAKLTLVRRGRPVTVDVQLDDRVATVADDLLAAPGPPHGGRLSSIVTQTDAAHAITLTTHGDADRHVRIADAAGSVLYDGPLNTAADHARLPTDCRPKVEAIEKNWERFKQIRGASPDPRPPALPAPRVPDED